MSCGGELLRFVTDERHPVSGCAVGMFQAAYRVRGIPFANVAAVERELGWFGSHLDEPRRFVRTRSKGYYRRDTVALSWFKPEAHDAIAHARALAQALSERGIAVHTLHTRHPGYVVYEDDDQVVAVPFRDR